MSFIEWITRRPGFRSLEDSFAINRASMLTGLRRAVVQQQKRCDEVLLVAHFFDTFVVLQDYLGREKIDYQIVDRSFEGSNFPIREDGKAGTVRLALASLIVDRPSEEPAGSSNKAKRPDVAVMVCERHPNYRCDKRLYDAVKQFDASVTIGYMLSLDDVVVKEIANPMVLQVLNQLGLDESEMIASHYLSRLLERRLHQNGRRYTGQQEADSAVEWIKLNSR